MRMRSSAAPDWTWHKGFWLSIVLGYVLLLMSFSRVLTQYRFLFWEDKVLASIVDVSLFGTLLGRQVLAFVLGQLLLYGAFGVSAWLLARLTHFGFQPKQTKRSELVLAWFLLLTIATFIANAYYVPWSGLGDFFADTVSYEVFGIAAAQIVLTIVAFAVLVTVAFAARRFFILHAARARAWTAAVIVVASAGGVAEAFVSYQRRDAAALAATPSKTNIILIGVDSMRPDFTVLGGDTTHAPNMNEFIKQARVFRDTTTPLARTFPSWMSILTGRHPHDTGALMNLTSRDTIKAYPTLADVLRKQGYRTTFAIDEVRFANIDESFGFDQIVTPPMGAGDFLFGALNDTPLTNLVADTWLGRLLFPHSYANRAAARVYDPGTFTRRLAAELEFQSPFFLAVHFTLPHYPYFWAKAPRYSPEGKAHEGQSLYGDTIHRADAQVGELLKLLEARGALKNAIVVLLSDHGEGLGGDADVLLTQETRDFQGFRIPASASGHGTSVLSPPQYQVVLAMRSFGSAALAELPPAIFDVPASLEDIMPTLLDVQNIEVADAKFSGVSLADILSARQSAAAAHLESRIRFTETEFNPPALAAGFAAEAEIAKQNARFYEVQPSSSRMILRASKRAEAMADRQYSAIGRHYVLAAVPLGDATYKYVLVARDRSEVRLLQGPGDLESHPEAGDLWRALQQRFALDSGMTQVAAKRLSPETNAR
jgi:hypothetical protein